MQNSRGIATLRRVDAGYRSAEFCNDFTHLAPILAFPTTTEYSHYLRRGINMARICALFAVRGLIV